VPVASVPDHIQSFQQHPAAGVVAIAEVNAERGEAGESSACRRSSPTTGELLKRPDIDVVSIALPNYLHAPVALAALKAGKDVMLDKPDRDQQRRRRGSPRSVKTRPGSRACSSWSAENGRFIVETQTAKQLPSRRACSATSTTPRPPGRAAAASPASVRWFTQRKYAGGGVTYDVGVHALDPLSPLDWANSTPATVTGKTYAQFGAARARRRLVGHAAEFDHRASLSTSMIFPSP
jgi:predicted dehydrogenase